MSKFLSTTIHKQRELEDAELSLEAEIRSLESLLHDGLEPQCKAQQAVVPHPRDKALIPSERFGE